MPARHIIHAAIMASLLAFSLQGCEGCASSVLAGDGWGAEEAAAETAGETAPDSIEQEEQESGGCEGRPAPGWARTYRHPFNDTALSILQTADCGYIAAGMTDYSGPGGTDFWILKLDESGRVLWERVYGGENNEEACCVRQTSDGGYLAAGWTYSFTPGQIAAWVLKLDAGGDPDWQKAYPGGFAQSMELTPGGGAVAAGAANAFGGGSWDFWVLELDADGNVLWQKTYGGPGDEYARSIGKTSDGGYIVAGESNSFGEGGDDVWILRLDAGGGVLWQKNFGVRDPVLAPSVQRDLARHVQQTADGGFIVAADCFTDISEYDFLILKLDPNGNIAWKTSCGFRWEDLAYVVRQTADGGYVVAGTTRASGGRSSIWVITLDSLGGIVWQKMYGGANDETAYDVRQTAEGGFIVAGETFSFSDGDSDFWIVKMDADGGISSPCTGVLVEDTSVHATPVDVITFDTSVSAAPSAASAVATSSASLQIPAEVRTQCGD